MTNFFKLFFKLIFDHIKWSLNIFKKDSSFVTVSQSGKLDYIISPKNSVSAGILSTTSTNLLDNNILSINDYKSSFYTLNYLHIKRQRYNLLFPINFQFDITTGFGNRTFDDIKESQNSLAINSFKIFNSSKKTQFIRSIRLLSCLYRSGFLYKFTSRYFFYAWYKLFKKNTYLWNKLYRIIEKIYYGRRFL